MTFPVRISGNSSAASPCQRQEVEEVYHKGRDISGVVVAEIVSVENHPDSKKLHLLKVNTGSEILDIVCGAPNVSVGQRVALATVGGRVCAGEIKKATVARLRFLRNVLRRR